MSINNNSTHVNGTASVKDVKSNLKNNDGETGDCQLLDNWALVVQACMGMIAISILIGKFYKFIIFFFVWI